MRHGGVAGVCGAGKGIPRASNNTSADRLNQLSERGVFRIQYKATAGARRQTAGAIGPGVPAASSVGEASRPLIHILRQPPTPSALVY